MCYAQGGVSSPLDGTLPHSSWAIVFDCFSDFLCMKLGMFCLWSQGLFSRFLQFLPLPKAVLPNPVFEDPQAVHVVAPSHW